MDIRSEESERGIDELFTTWGKIAVLVSILFAICIGFLFGVKNGAISTVSTLVIIGIIITDSWNRELRTDGYASLSQLYTSYIATLFLALSIIFMLSSIYGLALSIAIAILVSILYIITLNSVAFRNVDDHDVVANPYVGPAVVYVVGGPYYDHVESIAEDKKNEQDD